MLLFYMPWIIMRGMLGLALMPTQKNNAQLDRR
jgi:hypothetical protein